jgi:hypothetical protein
VAIKDFIIKRKIKKTQRTIQFFNYETAKTTAVLYKIENKQDFETLKEYTNYLMNKGLKVYSLGFVIKHTEIGTVYFGQGSNYFFSEKHITKSGTIKDSGVLEFISQQVDILINVSNSNNFYLEYVFALSKAKFKVSGIIDCKYSDMNINCSGNKNSSYFIEQVNHYLSTIKKA